MWPLDNENPAEGNIDEFSMDENKTAIEYLNNCHGK